MSSPYLTMIKIDGEIKVAHMYSFDGYPKEAGLYILHFLRRNNSTRLKEILSNCKIMDEGVYASYCLYGFAPNEDALHLDYPSLVLGGADELLERLINGRETMSRYQIDYAYSGDICWAYMIDFDTMNFEVYKGFNRNELESNERFYNGGKKLSSFYPIVLRKSYCLEVLPTDEVFLNDLCED